MARILFKRRAVPSSSSFYISVGELWFRWLKRLTNNVEVTSSNLTDICNSVHELFNKSFFLTKKKIILHFSSEAYQTHHHPAASCLVLVLTFSTLWPPVWLSTHFPMGDLVLITFYFSLLTHSSALTSVSSLSGSSKVICEEIQRGCASGFTTR